ncbi:TPA: tail fiber assembly protein [Serratia marcescens]
MKYSPSENAFYPEELLENYMFSGSLPDDLIDVSYDVFSEFTSVPPPGKVRVSGINGHPEWGDKSPPTHQELIFSANKNKNELMTLASFYIAPLQDAVDLDIANDNEIEQLTAWKMFRVSVSRVDTTKPLDIEWPLPPKSKDSTIHN